MYRFDWNPNPKKVLFIDLETQSPTSLSKCGVKAYLSDKWTRIMCLCVAEPAGDVLVWVPPGRYPSLLWDVKAADIWPEGFGPPRPLYIDRGDSPPEALSIAIARGITFVAHNAEGFDAPAYEKLIGGESPTWYDTVPAARAGGLPGGLDKLGHYFTGRGKDPGKDAPKLLYKAKVKRSGTESMPSYNLGTVDLWKAVLRYNIADVLLLERVFNETLEYGEPDVLAAHSACNQRGLGIDRRYCETLAGIWDELEAQSFKRLEALTDGIIHANNIRSGPQMLKWLATQGMPITTLRRDALERLYESPEEYDAPPHVVEVLKLRQVATRAGKGKVAAILSWVDSDDRARGLLKYYGAHTGRWAGVGIQPQNFSRGIAGLDVEGLLDKHEAGKLSIEQVVVEAASASTPEHEVSTDDVLSSLLRPVFRAGPGNRLLIVDYAAVECRGIAWCAGQADLLQLFREGRDVYLDMASVVFGRVCTKADKAERQIGKVIVLGCGYGMSAKKFGSYCVSQGIDLTAAGTTAEACVTAYRSKNSRIVQLWRDYEAATLKAMATPGESVLAGRCVFLHDGKDLTLTLPSGRPMIYRGCSLEKRVPKWGDDPTPKDTIVYTSPRGHEATLYGGLIAENCVSGACRDLLATALVRCELEAIPVVLHVHDEIVAEVPAADAPEKLRRLADIMAEPPPWAEGFPISVEGFDSLRYMRVPLETQERCDSWLSVEFSPTPVNGCTRTS